MAIKNLGATGHAFKDETFEKVAKKLKYHNIDRIQLTPGKITTEVDWNKNCYTPALANYIKEKLDGIHISSLGCYINMTAEGNDEVERFCKNIEFAKFVGADIICTETGMCLTEEETLSEKTYQRAVENGRKIAKCAEKFGITVGIEVYYPHCIRTPQLLKKFLEDINSPNMCCLFDPAGLMDGTDFDRQYEIIDTYFELLRDKIRLMHLKDIDFVNGKRVAAPIGQGKMDFDYIFKKIDENLCAIDLIVESVDSEYIVNGLGYLRKYM